MDREIIANHIKDEDERNEFKNGVQRDYLIEGLDFSTLTGDYSFDDGNEYMFEGCRIVNRKLKFSGRDIGFYQCVFGGDTVDMSNMDLGAEDSDVRGIEICDCRSEEGLNTFNVSASVLDASNNQISARKGIAFSGIRGVFKDTHDGSYYKSEGDIDLDFVDSEFVYTYFHGNTIGVHEYDNCHMKHSIFCGKIKPVKRLIPLDNITHIEKSVIDEEPILDSYSQGLPFGIPFPVEEEIKEK